MRNKVPQKTPVYTKNHKNIPVFVDAFGRYYTYSANWYSQEQLKELFTRQENRVS